MTFLPLHALEKQMTWVRVWIGVLSFGYDPEKGINREEEGQDRSSVGAIEV